MNGPIWLAVLFALGYILWKYRVQIRNFWWPAGGGAQAPQQPGAAPAAPGNPPARPATNYGRIFGNAVFILVGLAVLFWGVINTPQWVDPSFAAVSKWAWSHWLALLILWGILEAFIALNQPTLGAAAKVLQYGLRWAVFALFIGSLVMSWFTSIQTSLQRAPVQERCSDVSARETHTCQVSSDKWSNWIQFADGSRDDGKQICFSYGVEFEKKQDGLATMWRFKAKDGELSFKYRLFAATDDCAKVEM